MFICAGSDAVHRTVPAGGERLNIGSVANGIEVDDGMVGIIGRRDLLQPVIAGRNTDTGGVRGKRKWRAPVG